MPPSAVAATQLLVTRPGGSQGGSDRQSQGPVSTRPAHAGQLCRGDRDAPTGTGRTGRFPGDQPGRPAREEQVRARTTRDPTVLVHAQERRQGHPPSTRAHCRSADRRPGTWHSGRPAQHNTNLRVQFSPRPLLRGQSSLDASHPAACDCATARVRAARGTSAPRTGQPSLTSRTTTQAPGRWPEPPSVPTKTRGTVTALAPQVQGRPDPQAVVRTPTRIHLARKAQVPQSRPSFQ